MVASDSAVNSGKIQVVMEEHRHTEFDSVIINALLRLPVRGLVRTGTTSQGHGPVGIHSKVWQ